MQIAIATSQQAGAEEELTVRADGEPRRWRGPDQDGPYPQGARTPPQLVPAG